MSRILSLVIIGAALAGDADIDLLPPHLPAAERDNLLRFLQKNGKPDRFIPKDAKVVSDRPDAALPKADAPATAPIKQYAVQITPQRPVPGQERPGRVHVYYYRPNPAQGKPGITVKHTVDLASGEQVGPTEVLLNRPNTPLAREELAEALALAKEKLPAVQAVYQDRDAGSVRYQYLQQVVYKKNDKYDIGDRVVRFEFGAPAAKNSSAPLCAIVNLTKGTAVIDAR